ncbi:NAD-dependent epimerase/dehydratase family protein [bacterium]|nr:NAD-dependent epimerase/dehydratase family protein [bacterium]
MSKKVLITGGSGFMGFHLAAKLCSEGYEVDILDNFSRGPYDKDLEILSKYPNAKIIKGDMRYQTIFNSCSVDYNLVFHFAAILGVANVLERPFNVLTENISMFINVLEFAKSLKNLDRLIFPSTSEVYAGTLEYFQLKIPTPEKTPLAVSDLSMPRTSYMLSKIYGEALCWHSQVPFTIIRPHNIFGPRMGMSHVIPELLKKAFEAPNGGEIEVASVNHTRTFCFINDAIEQIKRIAELPICEGIALNVGNQTPEISMQDLAAIVVETLGKSLTITEKYDTPGSVTRRCPDMTETTRRIEYSAQCELRTGVKITYEWYRDNLFQRKGI